MSFGQVNICAPSWQYMRCPSLSSAPVVYVVSPLLTQDFWTAFVCVDWFGCCICSGGLYILILCIVPQFWGWDLLDTTLAHTFSLLSSIPSYAQTTTPHWSSCRRLLVGVLLWIKLAGAFVAKHLCGHLCLGWLPRNGVTRCLLSADSSVYRHPWLYPLALGIHCFEPCVSLSM